MNKLIYNNNIIDILNINKIGEGKHSSVYKCNNDLIIKFSKQINSLLKKEYSYSQCPLNNYIKGLGKYNNVSVLVMKNINGITLKELLSNIKNNKKQLSFNFYYEYFIELNNLINQLHNYYIFHNDIIPQNIFIDNQLNFQIIDFSESFYYNNEQLTEFYNNNNNSFKINLNNKLCKCYSKYLRNIDKFNIFIKLFKYYYLFNTDKQQDKINNINSLMIKHFKMNNKKLIKFILDNKLFYRLNVPYFMLTLYKNNLLNYDIIHQLKKILIIINYYNNLKLDFIYSLNSLFVHQPVRNIEIKRNEFLLLCIIYYSIIIYIKKNKIFIPKYFTSYKSFPNFISKLFRIDINILKKNNNTYEYYVKENENKLKIYYDNMPPDMLLFYILSQIN